MKTIEPIQLRPYLRRIQGDLTPEQFAASLGFSRQYFNQIVAGKKLPSDKFLKAIGARWVIAVKPKRKRKSHGK